MKDSRLQLALREWRQQVTQRATLVAMLAVAAVLAIMGPFETGAVMRLIPRFVYWLVMVALCYSWGALVDGTLRAVLGARRPLVKTVLSAGVTGVGVLALVAGINALALGYVPERGVWLEFFATVFAISLIVSGAFSMIERARPAPRPAGGPGPIAAAELSTATPSLLERLPLEKRGSLVALRVEDHYVRVHTVKGDALILMRLSDAIRETEPARGAQVHRSHWAAFDAVTRVRREGDRAILTMSHGPEVPVSRANLPKLREAGLLPERG